MDWKWTGNGKGTRLTFLSDSISTVISMGMSDNDFDLFASSSFGDVIIWISRRVILEILVIAFIAFPAENMQIKP